MQKANETRDKLISDFTENYMGKLFYFCLKKAGSTSEAEDLAQDIALQVITALNKGTEPSNFSAWVWQIARNRYAAWAKEKRDLSESLTGHDIGDYEIPDGRIDHLDEMIYAEQMSLLRRELAFIKSDYRNVLVAYYIENKSVREIADILSLSVNTVKSKLLRARQILKEGMNMAREFGKRSYKPEDIALCASGPQPSGLPWSIVQRQIPKNILLQANNNPSTLEDLSMELGIALPYMQEEVDILYRGTLLEKIGDKYITNFFILDKDSRVDIYNALRRGSKERSRLLREFIESSIGEIRALGIAENHIDDNTVSWWLIPFLTDWLIKKGVKDHAEPPTRANGETWGFVGCELVDIPENTGMGHNGTFVRENEFWTYKYGDYSMWDQCGEPSWEEAELLCRCLKEGKKVAAFTDREKELWDGINGRYAHESDDGSVCPDVIVLNLEKQRKLILQLFGEHPNYELLLQNVKEAYDTVKTVFDKCGNEVLHKSIGYYIRMELYAMRMMSVHDLVGEGYLKVPEDPSKTSLGMHIILR